MTEYVNPNGIVLNFGPRVESTHVGEEADDGIRSYTLTVDSDTIGVAADFIAGTNNIVLPAGTAVMSVIAVVKEAGVGAGTIDVALVDDDNTNVVALASFTGAALGGQGEVGTDGAPIATSSGEKVIRIVRNGALAGATLKILVQAFF